MTKTKNSAKAQKTKKEQVSDKPKTKLEAVRPRGGQKLYSDGMIVYKTYLGG
jgi:hypothetical protein